MWPSRLTAMGARPDLVLITVTVWAALRGVEEGVAWAFIGGLLLDFLSGGPLGLHALALVPAAFVAGQSWGQALGVSIVRLLLLAVVSALIYHFVVLIVLAWGGYAVEWAYALSRVVGPSLALTVILAPLVRIPLSWLDRRIRGERFRL
ncbi:MAG: rod shape-determining protein MreD [Anaerolineae bacterium]|nr:rod shape-determining protein MreD [Anaerolineae bacterium]